MQEAIRAKLKASQPFARAMVSIVCAFTLVCGISMPQLALANERGGDALTVESDLNEVTQESTTNEEDFDQSPADITEDMPVENDATDEVNKTDEIDEAVDEDTDTSISDPADDPSVKDETDIKVPQSVQDVETADESALADSSLSTTDANEDAPDADESLAPKADNAISAVFWGTTSGKVVKAIEADANGKYIIKAGEAPAVPATCTFSFSNDLGINFSVTATFEGWILDGNVYSEEQIENLPALSELLADPMGDEQFTKDSGALAYSGFDPCLFKPFDSDFNLQDNEQWSIQDLVAGNVVVFNPVYKIADEDIAHICIVGLTYENGGKEPWLNRPQLEYFTPKNYVLSDVQINKIVEKAKQLFGASKVANYSGIFGDFYGNTAATLKKPITAVPGFSSESDVYALFYLDKRDQTSDSIQSIEGVDNASADVGSVYDIDNPGISPTIVVKAQKVAAGSQDYQTFKNIINVETVGDIIDVDLLVNGTPRTEDFGSLVLALPVDSKYNGHTLRVHHYHESDGSVSTYDCIVRDGFVRFSVDKLSLFGIEDLGVANVYKDPVSDSGNSGNAGNAGNAGNVGNAGSTGAPASGATTKPVVNDNVAQQNENIQASAPTQPDAQANASTLPATGDDVSASTFALTALISAALACIASFALRSRKHGLHAR